MTGWILRLWHWLCSTFARPEGGALARCAALRRALDAMPERTRLIFEMHCFCGMDYRAIALRMGTNVETIERCIAEAMLYLDCTGGAEP